MGRLTYKGAGYDAEARKRAVRAAVTGPLVWLGILLSGISMFSLISRTFAVPLPAIPLGILDLYRNFFYPLIDWSTRFTGIAVGENVKDLVSLYLLFGGVLSRPLAAIFVEGGKREGSQVFDRVLGTAGSKLDQFLNWAQEQIHGRITWWRRPLFSAVAILVMPLTIWVFSKYPHTMDVGGALGTYQAAQNNPRDTATYDKVIFDCRWILGLQFGLSALVAGTLVVGSLVW